MREKTGCKGQMNNDGILAGYTDKELLQIIGSDVEAELRKRGYRYGWYKQEEVAGCIYILYNESYPNHVKIGFSSDVVRRMKDLYTTGVIHPFHCYAIYKVKRRLADKDLQEIFCQLAPNIREVPNREFYQMGCEDAYLLLQRIAKISGTEELLIKNPFQDTYFENPPQMHMKGSTETQERGSENKEEKQNRKARAPQTTWAMLDIPEGAELVFLKDENIKVVTVGSISSVRYNGEVYSLSTVAQTLLASVCGRKMVSARGADYFLYNGELLTERRKRMGF